MEMHGVGDGSREMERYGEVKRGNDVLVIAVPGADDLLILPMEVEVSSQPGIYSPQSSLDFGLLHSSSEPKSLPLYIINSSTKPVEITVSSLSLCLWRTECVLKSRYSTSIIGLCTATILFVSSLFIDGCSVVSVQCHI